MSQIMDMTSHTLKTVFQHASNGSVQGDLFNNEFLNTVTRPVITSPTVSAAALAGILAHLGLFIHGEWHVKAPAMFTGSFFVLPSFIALFSYLGYNLKASFAESGILIAAFLTSLFTSIVMYRRFFHRLRNFNGPFMFSVSKLWHVTKVLDSKNYLALENIRKRYGDYVRTGPNELTVFDPEIVALIDGHGSPCDKAVWYDVLLPDVAVNTARDRHVHDARRKIWNKAFTNEAINEYQKRVVEYTHLLETHVEKAARTKATVNITELLQWFTFDVMGEFAFGKSFGMLNDGKWHFAVELLEKAMRILGPTTPVPWLAQIGIRRLFFTQATKDWHAMMNWCRAQLRLRMKEGTSKLDITNYLLKASEERGTVEQDMPWLYGDTITVIVAGSDTTAINLLFCFYELALDQARTDKLRDEISKVDIYSPKALESCDYLNGVINEALRMYPPVPTHGYRQTPPSGINVGGRHIPGGVTVVAPRYSLGRLESSYVEPNNFVPERWYSRPEMVKDKRGFRPFGEGRYGCVGKTMALREVRFVLALLISRFDVRFAPGENGKAVTGDMRDFLTAAPGRLDLRFTEVAPHS